MKNPVFSSSAVLAAFLLGDAGNALAEVPADVEEAPKATSVQIEGSYRDIPVLQNAFVDTSPAVGNGTFPVRELTLDSAKKAQLVSLAKEIGEGTYGQYDSLLIAHNGHLVFESYTSRGRINLIQDQASATKGYTSLVLGRAIQMGYLSMADLDKPLISFLKDIDSTSLVEGAELITLDKALTMQGGLTIESSQWELFKETNAAQLRGQGFVQNLLEQSEPITEDTQDYRYGNFNPMLVMTVIDAVVPGSAMDFIKNEVLDKLQIVDHRWATHISGLPEAGWRVSLTSRDMLKWGELVRNDGRWNGEQLISAEYIEKATSRITKPAIDWMPDAYRYGYFWYQIPLLINEKSYSATLTWGGGGQRVIVVKELGVVIAITGNDADDQIMDQISQIVIPAFIDL